MVELIKKKRDGIELSREELSLLVDGLVSGEIPDYQISAFLMAVYFKGMTDKETAIFTDLMMHSGDVIDLSEINGIKVDKHSTGGVGDKTTLVLAPLVAAAGAPVAKMSGRGLGHTGGTLDKLESIRGLSVDMTRQEFIDQIKLHGIAVSGQNEHLVPADKKLYGLRDVTATVDNISLISSSIMSKKLACGANAIVIDIKVGSGAYMKTLEQAEELAHILIDIGSKMDREIITVISAMNEPLGYAVGNAIEVKEAIDTLKGNGPEDLTELCLVLGSYMLVLGGIRESYDESYSLLKELIQSGAALQKFEEFITEQGGDSSVIQNPGLLPQSKNIHYFRSAESGFISKIDALNIGKASVKLGAGRITKDSIIDHGAGILLKKKVGDKVEMGDTLAVMFTEHNDITEAISLLEEAYFISALKPEREPLILKTIAD